MRAAWIEVSEGAIAWNIREMRRLLTPDCRIYAVVKDNACGHGLVRTARLALKHGCDALAVAILNEALELRESGMNAPILVMGGILEDEAEAFVRHEVTPTIGRPELIEPLDRAARCAGKCVSVQVKIDTGMSRIGVAPDSAISLCSQIASSKNLKLAAVWTHLATADEDPDPFSHEQFHVFRRCLDNLRAAGIEVPEAHICNSAGIARYRHMYLDAVRPGLMLYGLDPCRGLNPFGFRYLPAMSVRARLVFVKTILPGQTVSYGRTFTASRPTRVGTVPVGYGDGYDRGLSNNGRVLIHGREAPIIGRVCMDQFMVDLTNIPQAQTGDLVTLVGRDGEQHIPLHELADRCGTIVNETACRMGTRLPRTIVS